MPGSTFARWLKAARPLAHGNIAPPILLGAALGARDSGGLDARMLALAFGFGVLDHLLIVFYNDVADVEADRLNDAPTMLSGGSRVLVDGDLTVEALWRGARLAAVGLLLLSVLASPVAPLLPPLALAAMVILWLYSGAPVRLSYRGGGAVLQGLGVGVVLPLVGYATQSTGQSMELPSPMTLVPSLLLGVAGNLLTALPDAAADRRANKRTLASVRGVRVAAWAALLISSVAFLLGANQFSSTPTEAQVLTVVPLLFVLPALLLLASLDDPRLRLRFVLLVGAAGASAILAWSVALLSP